MTPRNFRKALFVGLVAAGGCATTPTETWQVQPPVVRASLSGPPLSARKRRALLEHSNTAVGVVERSLHERGIRFGTDGTPGSLYQFLHSQYPEIPASEARAGMCFSSTWAKGQAVAVTRAWSIWSTVVADLCSANGATAVPGAATSILANRTPGAMARSF